MVQDKVSFIKMDVLKELGTIGSGRAATALADLMNTTVSITVPDVRLYPFQQLLTDISKGKTEENFFALNCDLKGDITGKQHLLLAPNEAKILASMLLGSDPASVNLKDDMVMSSLKEVANILLSSYVNALSELTSFTIIVDVPNLSPDVNLTKIDEFLSKTLTPTNNVLYIRSVLTVNNKNFEGFILFIPDDISLQKIFQKLGLA